MQWCLNIHACVYMCTSAFPSTAFKSGKHKKSGYYARFNKALFRILKTEWAPERCYKLFPLEKSGTSSCVKCIEGALPNADGEKYWYAQNPVSMVGDHCAP